MGNQANIQRLQRVILLAVGLFAGWSVHAAWLQLPPRVASHFNARGQPDGYMPRETFFRELLLVGGALIVLPLLAPMLLRLLPSSLINMPHKDYWLAPERRDHAFAYIGVWCGWLVIATSLLLVIMLRLTLRANIAGGRLDMLAAGLSLGVYIVGVLTALVFFTRQFNTVPSMR